MFQTGELSDQNYLTLSTRNKLKKDKEIAKKMVDYYSDFYEGNSARVAHINENFDIHAGRWPQIENEAPAVSFLLQNENVTAGGGEIRHYPIADRVSKSVVGDIIMRPLIPVVTDKSAKGRSEQERQQLERVREYFFNTDILPRKQELYKQFYQQYGQQLGSIPQEDLQQMQGQIDQQAFEETAEEIKEAMERYRTPEQMIYQAFLNNVLLQQRVKEKFDMGGENAVVTAEEYYRVSIINGEPTIEVLNPKFVKWGGSEHVERSEDATYASYTQYITAEDVIGKYGDKLSLSDIKKLSNVYSPIPGYMSDKREDRERNIDQTLVDMVAESPQLRVDGIKTREGQEKLKALYQNVSFGHRHGHGIREAYVTWKWSKKVKIVERVDKETEEVEILIRSEHYVKNPMLGDVKVTTRLIPQAWHGVKLGESGDIYVDVEPLPYQYGSDNSPYDIKLSIYGGKDNTFMNNTKNASLLDLSRPWQFRYNVLMKKLEEYEATDYGKVLLASVAGIPESFSIPEWFTSLTRGKVGFIHNHNEGMNALDRYVFRSEDMSNTADIASAMQKLEYFEKKVYSSMYNNPVKAGNISPYATNANVAQSAQAADRQMLKFHNARKLIRERVLKALLNLSVIAYEKNTEKKKMILDDGLRAYFDLNVKNMDMSEIGLYIVDDYRESEKLEQMKQLAMTIMQNGGKARDMSAIMNADSMGEVDEILMNAEKEAQKEAELNHNRQKELMDQQAQIQQQQLQLQEQMKTARDERNNAVKLEMARLNSQLLENASDINENKVNDFFEKTMIEIEAKDRQDKRQLDFALEELREKTRLKELEIKKRYG